MGVSGLKTLMEKSKMCSSVKMYEEIKKCSRRLRKRRIANKSAVERPIIIFDLLSLCYIFMGGTIGMLGERHERNLKIMETIFKKLIVSGANLVFFCDGQVQNFKIGEWCKRRNEKDKKIMRCMEKGKARIEQPFACNPFVEKVLSLLDQMKCDVVVSTEVECDQAMAKYALENKQKVLAIVSNDTDMLIFEGHFQLWVIDLKGFKLGRAKELDRRRLLTFLDLTRDEMKFFATIKGNDFTLRYIDKEMRKMDPTEVVSKVKERFSAVNELNENLYNMVAEVMLKEGITLRADHLKSIEQSLKYYELNFTLEKSDQRVNVLKHCLENGYAFQYSAQFIDFKSRCNEKFFNLILQAIEKAAGVLKMQQPDNSCLDKITIITKTDVDRKYEKLNLVPQLVSRCGNAGKNENEIKWANFLFCLGLHFSDKELLTIRRKKGIAKVIFAIRFLLQVKEITVSQADALILVHCENCVPELTDPDSSGYDTIRTAQAYLRMLTLVDDMFHICGLSEYTKHPVRYDGVYYDHLIKKRTNLKHRIEQTEMGLELRTAIYNNCRK